MKLNKLLKLILVAVLLNIGGKSYAQVTIGDNKPPEEFSALEIISNAERGLRMPHLTTTQRDDMTKSAEFQSLKTSLAKGLTIYNSITDCLEFWNGGKWVSMCADVECIPMTGTGTLSPASATVNVGDNQTFTLSGLTRVARYEWFVDNTLQTTTTPTLTYTVPSGTATGLSIPVYVVAYDDCNNSKRFDATITTCRPLSGTASISPTSVSLEVGKSQVFSVTGVTNATSYQWYLNGSAIPGQTSSTYNYTATTAGSATIYVMAYGCNGTSAKSNTASVTITPACTPVQPGSISSPTGSSLTAGNQYTFTTSGFAYATSYQWTINGTIQSGTGSSVTYTVPSSFTGTLTVSVIARGCNNSQQSASKSYTVPSSLKIEISDKGPIRPLTMSPSSNQPLYPGTRLRIPNFPAGAKVTWEIDYGNEKEYFYESDFYWRPKHAPSSMKTVTIVATVRFVNNTTAELKENIQIYSICSSGGSMWLAEPKAFQFYGGAGRGYVRCFPNGSEWWEEGVQCANGYLFNPNAKGCTPGGV
ncbi:hypothetical protein [Prevotella sp. 10(H)]|uniref:hypothetical protein n=1 Tax=Prevotella sp. 10(H) TaxID=1158294 RepID=UPI0004A6F09D|nr:hypothetical protein [Prevotella sp. 10(H)]